MTQKIVLKAAEFSSIQAAIQKYTESISTPTAQIFTTKANVRPFNSRGKHFSRGNFNHREGNNYTNFSGNGNRYHTTNQPRYPTHRHTYSRGRRNFNNQNRFQQYDQKGARVFYTQPMPENNGHNSRVGNIMQQQQLEPHSTLQNQPHLTGHPFVSTLGQFSQSLQLPPTS